MYVCMYMHICMSILCMYTYMYVYMCIYMYVCMSMVCAHINRYVVYFRVAAFKKGQHPHEEVKRGIAYAMNLAYMENMEEQVVCVFDFTNAGISNIVSDIYILTYFVTSTD